MGCNFSSNFAILHFRLLSYALLYSLHLGLGFKSLMHLFLNS